MTALAAMQERLISPFQTIPCTPSFEVHGQVFKNWDPYVNQPMTLPEAIGASCDTYFYNLGYAFYALPPDRGHPLQGWASRFGFGGPTGIDVGPEQSGLLPTPEWRQATYTAKTDPGHWQIDRLWKPGDSIQLAIGQKDLLVTPLQMVRFYSLIANGGKLVSPHVLYAVDEPGSGRHYLNPPAPKSSKVDPAALAVVRDGLYRATHASYGTATAVFGNFPIPIAGKTGTAEKVVQPPGYSQPLLQDQSWWCGYGPADATETPKIAVCAVIENGGHGGTAAAPAALKVFEQFFHTQDDRRPRADPLRLAVADLVYTPTERSRARARRRELTQEASLLARLDWVMLGTVLAIVGFGLWSIAGITRHDVAGSPDYYVYRQLVFVAIGLVGLVAVDPDRPRDLPPLREADLRRDAAPVRVRVPRRDGRPRVEALDRPRLLPLPAVRVREAAHRPRARRLPRRPVPADGGVADVADRGRARRCRRRCSSSSSRTSAPRSSTLPRSSACC